MSVLKPLSIVWAHQTDLGQRLPVESMSCHWFSSEKESLLTSWFDECFSWRLLEWIRGKRNYLLAIFNQDYMKGSSISCDECLHRSDCIFRYSWVLGLASQWLCNKTCLPLCDCILRYSWVFGLASDHITKHVYCVAVYWMCLVHKSQNGESLKPALLKAERCTPSIRGWSLSYFFGSRGAPQPRVFATCVPVEGHCISSRVGYFLDQSSEYS